MFIQYAGPRVQITHSSINIQEHHTDKYIYFQTLFALFKQIEASARGAKPFVFQPVTTKVSDDDILAWISAYHPNIIENIVKASEAYQKELNHEYKRVKKNPTLTEDERDAWLYNLDMMREYRIQRAKNKILYGYMLDTIIDVAWQKELEEFVLPFSLENYHLIQALANHMVQVHKIYKPVTVIKRSQNGATFIYVILFQG